MYSHSAEYVRRMRSPHTRFVRAEVLDAAGNRTPLSVDSGSLNIDRLAAVRRRCTLDLSSNDLLVRDANDLLWPRGNVIRLWGGISNGSYVEEFPLGVFRISAPNQSDTGTVVTTVEASDLSRTVSRNRFQDLYVIPLGTNYADAIRELVLSRLPGTQFNFMPTSRTTPLLVFTSQDDPWAMAQKMAMSIGAEVFFDVDGLCVLRSEPDPATDPISWRYREGEGILTGVSRKIDEELTYNVWIVTGESSSAAPVRAVARDDDPTSPTYYLTYGEVPYFYTSAFIVSQAQAQDVADAFKRAGRPFLESVSVSSIPNFAHDASDVVEIERARASVSGKFVLDSIEIGLSVDGDMRLNTRKRAA